MRLDLANTRSQGALAQGLVCKEDKGIDTVWTRE